MGDDVRRPDGPDPEAAAAPAPALSVIVPAYNEESVLAGNLAEIHGYLSDHPDVGTFELIVVDDGSTDDTGAIADRFARHRPEVRVIHHRTNGNLGRALRTGIAASAGRQVVTLDCDLTYSVEHVTLLLAALRGSGAQIAVASAYMAGGRVSGVPPVRALLSRNANRYLRHATRGQLSTLTCMVRAYDGDFVRSLHLRSRDSDLNTEILTKAELLGVRCVEVAAHLDWTRVPERTATRPSTLRTGRTIRQCLLAGCLLRPSHLFAVGGAAFAVVAVVLAVVVAGAVATGDGLADHLALVVLGAAAVLASVNLLAAALLATLAHRAFAELYDLGMTRRWGGRAWPSTTTVRAGANGASEPGATRANGRSAEHRTRELTPPAPASEHVA